MKSVVCLVTASYLLSVLSTQITTQSLRPNYKTMKSVVCFGDCFIFAKCIYYLLKLPLRPNYKTMKSVVCFGDCLIFAKCIYYLLKLTLRPNYKTMKSVVCFGDGLIFAKCIIYSTYHLDQIIR